jgi:NodT family efflux transporter outer membrane factor (OMF) lipoprotein
MSTPASKTTACAALSVLLASCTVGPNFNRPSASVPPHWNGAQGIIEQPAVSSAVPERWWQSFQDPLLDSLIARGVGSNLDLRVSLLRLDEARVARGMAAAGAWPTLSADASYARNRFSDTTFNGALFNVFPKVHIAGAPALELPNPYNQYQLAGSASWEIDLFGRLRRSVESAEAQIQVSSEDQHAVLLSLLADVAQSYLDLRGAQARRAIAQENLATLDDLLNLTQQRRAAGMTTELDVANAAAEDASTRASLPTYELQITQDVHQLSMLLGAEPEALRAELQAAAPIPPPPPQVPIGLPSELARRRPDIRQAEASLHAATAQIGVDIGALFPKLTLTASGGFQSEQLGSLAEWASRFASFGPALDMPVFDRGRWLSVRLDRLKQQEAALSYQRTVLNALREVEDAIAAYGADQARRAGLDEAVRHNRDALAVARQRYQSGVSDFINVLDAERTLQQNQLSMVESTTAVASDLVRLYRALGGGWEEGSASAASRS